MLAPCVDAVFGTRDLAERILSLLPLATLRNVGTSCQSLRAAAVGAPGAWQAAAARHYQEAHPVHSTVWDDRGRPDIRAYFNLQRTVNSNIAAHRPQAPVEVLQCTHDSAHMLAPNSAWRVGWERGEFQVTDISLAQQLQKVMLQLQELKQQQQTEQLKQQQQQLKQAKKRLAASAQRTLALPPHAYRDSSCWRWNESCSTLLLPFGKAWGQLGVRASPADFHECGFITVTMQSGAYVTTVLPGSDGLPGQGSMQIDVRFAGRYTLLYNALPPQVHALDHKTHLWVFNSFGTKVNSAVLPAPFCHLTSCFACAPCGEIVLLKRTYARIRDLRTWRLGSGVPCRALLMAMVDAMGHDFWAIWSPASDAVLLPVSELSVRLIDASCEPLTAAQDLRMKCRFGGQWSSKGLALIGHPLQLRLYAVESNVLVLRHALDFEGQLPGILQVHFSPDWSCVIAWTPGGFAIVRIASGSVQVWRVSDPNAVTGRWESKPIDTASWLSLGLLVLSHCADNHDHRAVRSLSVQRWA